MADTHAKPNHDYHLVAPSGKPLAASISAFVMAVGLIMWMKDLTFGGLKVGPYLNLVGFGGVLYVMFVWWSDVIHEAQEEHAHTRVVQLSHRYGMILFIASEVMFFVAWFWAFFNVSLFPAAPIEFLRTTFTGGQWPPKGVEAIDPWHLPLFNTLILLTSGTTITWAHHALVGGHRNALKQGLIMTIILGALFTSVQAYEYIHAPFAFKQNIFGSTFFMATGFHGFHVIVGTIFLLVCLIRAFAGQFTPKQHIGFEFAAWYWHFVDVIWLFLFASIYVWGSWGAPIEAAVG